METMHAALQSRQDTTESVLPKRALVIEDYETTRKNIKQDLEEIGYIVDAFTTPREAAPKISKRKYQLSIIDISFDEHNNVAGDEFVRKNIDVLGKGKIVAFTAFSESINKKDKKLFNKIFIKAESDSQLTIYAKKIYDELDNENVTEKVDTKNPKWIEAKEKLIESLKKVEKKDLPMIWYKNYGLSANEILVEVNNENSEIGNAHVKMMFNWLNRENNTL
jgi:CheY-like chemotaxis protein